jgi:hypothetical protein
MSHRTGLLTQDLTVTFPLGAVVFDSRASSLTVAGQWRIFTALPVHPVIVIVIVTRAF